MKKIKILLSALLSFALAIPTSTFSVAAKRTTYAQGATVEANTNEDYAAPYQVTFVYKDKSIKNAVSVQVAGNFQFYSLDDEVVQNYFNTKSAAGATIYDVYEYQDGMFNTGYGLNSDMKKYEMEEISPETFQITLPVPGNLYYYDYYVTYRDGTTVTIQDPANPSVQNEANGHDSGHSLVYVGESSNTTLGQEYIYPRADQNGTTEFVPYTAVDGTTQYLEVYTPYGYDGTETLPVVYVSHGGGGQEAEWMHIGAVANIMDNLIAEGLTARAIVVTMDNTYFSWNYDDIKANLMDCIIPYMEANYNVSASSEDRAFCGLSMGGLTTTSVYSTLASQFKYLGIWSATFGDFDISSVEDADYPVLMLGAGIVDMGASGFVGTDSYAGLKNILDGAGIDYSWEVSYGAHDWGVWRDLFTRFAKDYLWQASDADNYTAGVEVAENTNEEYNAPYQITFTYKDDDAVAVSVAGNLQWYKSDDPVVEAYKDTAVSTGAVSYSAYDWEEGMFNTGYGIDGGTQSYDLVQVAQGVWQITIPVPGNEYYYDYTVTYADGTTAKIQDPANPSKQDPITGNDSGHSLVYVGNAENTTEGQEYIYARTDGQTGTVEFIPYTDIHGEEEQQQALGVYLPYNYDPSKTYKTIYVSHGGGGNEAEWMEIGSAANIMDNLIAEGLTDEAIIVTMNNTHLGWNYADIAKNFKECIIPLIEANYSVSTRVEDRALCGLSMGAMTTGTMLFSYTDLFGAYGSFSGCADPLLCEDLSTLSSKTIYLTGGNVDMAIQHTEDAEDSAFNRGKTVRTHEYLEENGVKHTYDLKNGAHDWGVWRAAFTTFVKDVLWNSSEDYEAGVEVAENTNEEYNAPYQITFTYKDDDAVAVSVAGNLQWYKIDDPVCADFVNTGVTTGAVSYSAYDWEEGMFNTGYGIDGGTQSYDLVQVAQGVWQITIPVPGNEYYYDYTVTYADGTTAKIQDPANPSPDNEFDGCDSGHSLVWVGSADNTTAGQEYIYARDGQNGTYSYVPYTAVDGTTQYLGVYLPYGYSEDQTYKVAYVSHGGGGNEAEWAYIGSAINIFDNLIAEGDLEATIFVTMDNTYFGWNYDKIAANFEDCIIPLIEANYSVGTTRNDRALCGLSMGSMTTTTLMQKYTYLFGYYGCFSGANVNVDVEYPNLLADSVIYLTAGSVDMALKASNGDESRKTVGIAQKLDELGVEYGYDLQYGAHDWGVWRSALTTFAKDYLWTMDSCSSFEDVASNKWYAPWVEEANALGLMTGTDKATFSPYAEMTRGMVVTVLYRMSGESGYTYSGCFSDVAADKYYSEAVEWAVENKIVTGYLSDNTFRPAQAVNRQELVLMLYRYAAYKGADVSARADLSDFPDASDVSAYAKDAMSWAVAKDLVSGDQGNLNPKNTANRAQAAKMMVQAYKAINA